MNLTSKRLGSEAWTRRTTLALIAVLTAIGCQFVSVSGNAMTCMAPYPDLDTALAAADQVFVGRLVRARLTHRGTVVDGTFEAIRVLKGPRDIKRVTFESMVDPGERCGLKIELNARYLVFVSAPQGFVLIGPNSVLLDGNASAERWVSKFPDNASEKPSSNR